jgi:hypothetical protein
MNYNQREGKCVTQWERSGMHTKFLMGHMMEVSKLGRSRLE